MFNTPGVPFAVFNIQNGCSEYGKCYVLVESRIIVFGLNFLNKNPH